jgi:AcrR family transcriptional regulator
MGKTPRQPDSKTGEKILEAARRVFTRKGFAAARMEDIAREAGMNRALIHYYFRSKQKMFDLIFEENMKKFFGNFLIVLQGKEPLELKIRKMVINEIDMLMDNQELPLFIVTEIAHNPGKLKEKISNLPVHMYKNEFIKQIQSEIRKGKIRKIDPRQFMINLISLSLWPFVAKPVIMTVMEIDQAEYEAMMNQRKTLIADMMIQSIKK